MRRSVNDLSLNFINKAQDNLEYLKNPLSMLDQEETPTNNLLSTSNFGNTQEILAFNVSAHEETKNMTALL